MAIHHDIPLKIQSSSSNCVQTSVSQFLSFYDIDISPDDIEKAVSVRKNQAGKPMGTLYADIGTWLKNTFDLKVKMSVFDVQIIDRSWAALSQKRLLDEMKHVQKRGVVTARTPYALMLIDSYVTYLQSGGMIHIAKCTNKLLRQLLDKGPVLAIISYTYMYDLARSKYDSSIKDYVSDPVEGKVVEHSIVLTGYEDGKYFYNDPDYDQGGSHVVADDVLIGAICTAQLNSDNYLLSVDPVKGK